MRVKFFRDGNYRVLEQEINEWLENNPDIIIRYVSHGADEKGDTVSIFYQPEVNFKPIQK